MTETGEPPERQERSGRREHPGGREPPQPPFERADGTDDERATVRERVRGVIAGLSEPATVSRVAETADCSVPGARSALREYARMGLAVQTDDSPESYERNEAYFEFLRGHRLARDTTTAELEARLADAYREHLGFVERFDAHSPDAVTVDERASPERAAAVFDWEALLADADDYREAYRQREGRTPVPVTDLPVPSGGGGGTADGDGTASKSDTTADDDTPVVLDPVYVDEAVREAFSRPVVTADRIADPSDAATATPELLSTVRDALSEPPEDGDDRRRADTGE